MSTRARLGLLLVGGAAAIYIASLEVRLARLQRAIVEQETRTDGALGALGVVLEDDLAVRARLRGVAPVRS